jgi:hypothetical protein
VLADAVGCKCSESESSDGSRATYWGGGLAVESRILGHGSHVMLSTDMLIDWRSSTGEVFQWIFDRTRVVTPAPVTAVHCRRTELLPTVSRW